MYLLALIKRRKSNWSHMGSIPITPTSHKQFSELETIYFMNRDNLALIFLAIDVSLLVAMFVVYKTCF